MIGDINKPQPFIRLLYKVLIALGVPLQLMEASASIPLKHNRRKINKKMKMKKM